MTREDASNILDDYDVNFDGHTAEEIAEAFEVAFRALEQEPIDKSAMMYEIYMEGVNMSGEYQGCWVRFKDIERIVDKYMGDTE